MKSSVGMTTRKRLREVQEGEDTHEHPPVKHVSINIHIVACIYYGSRVYTYIMYECCTGLQ